MLCGQERGFYSKAHSTWGLNFRNEPYRPTHRPEDLYKIKEAYLKQQEEIAKEQGAGTNGFCARTRHLLHRLIANAARRHDIEDASNRCWPG